MILTIDTHPPKASWKDEACSGEQWPQSSTCFLQDAALRLISRFQNKPSAFAPPCSPPAGPEGAAQAVLTVIVFSHYWHQATYTSSVDKTSI